MNRFLRLFKSTRPVLYRSHIVDSSIIIAEYFTGTFHKWCKDSDEAIIETSTGKLIPVHFSEFSFTDKIKGDAKNE